jgi:hypothetical protein
MPSANSFPPRRGSSTIRRRGKQDHTAVDEASLTSSSTASSSINAEYHGHHQTRGAREVSIKDIGRQFNPSDIMTRT